MRFEFYGMVFEAPKITFYLWSPWRCSALEHRLFEALREQPRPAIEEAPDEWKLHITDTKVAKSALIAIERVLKGWQEEADPGSERRGWRWLVEGDFDANGYDHTGAQASLWGLVRVSLERGGIGEPDKGEDVDLEGFGVEIPGFLAR